MKNFFRHVSSKISEWAGSTFAFVLAVIGVMVWLGSGPYFHFSETWLVAVGSCTDVVIFLMVFSIQSTQNRDSKAVRLKLNELIASSKQARDTFIGLEELTDGELAEIDSEFQQLLANIEAPTPLHKLHKVVKQEKAKRPAFYEHAEHVVDTLLGPLSGKSEHKG